MRLTMDVIEHPLRQKMLLPRRPHLTHLLLLHRLRQKAMLLGVKPKRKERPTWNPINRQKPWRKAASAAVNVRPGLFFRTSKHMRLESGSNTSQDVPISCMPVQFTVFVLICSLVDSPSNRVAAAKRKLLVVNDPQAKSFDAHRIECALCGLNVALQGEGDFNLTNWNQHKAQCIE